TFTLNLVSVAATPRPIARVAINGLETGERFEAVVDSNDIIRLCEVHDTAAPTDCTPGVQITPPTRIQLYGLVASDGPRGSFVLSTGCDQEQTLPVTKQFATAAAVVRVGCIEESADICNVS